MTRHHINRICSIVPLILSLMACVWVLGNVAGGARAGSGEGLGFRIFWLLIAAQLPFLLAYLLTIEWGRRPKIAGRLLLQLAALILAFSPVAYFHL